MKSQDHYDYEDAIAADWVVFQTLFKFMGTKYDIPLGKFLDIVEGMTLSGYGAVITVKSEGGSREFDLGLVKLPSGLSDKHREMLFEWIWATADERHRKLPRLGGGINKVIAELRRDSASRRRL